MSVRKLTDEEVANRINARESAELLAEMADAEADKYGKVFWEQLHKICCAHVRCEVVEEKQRSSMSDKEAKVFGKQSMMFGEYSGLPVDSVPLDRLVWYSENGFIEDLKRYLRSRRVDSEMEQDI